MLNKKWVFPENFPGKLADGMGEEGVDITATEDHTSDPVVCFKDVSRLQVWRQESSKLVPMYSRDGKVGPVAIRSLPWPETSQPPKKLHDSELWELNYFREMGPGLPKNRRD